MNSKVASAYSPEVPEVDFEELEMPQYVKELQLPVETTKKQNLSAFVEDIWVPQPELVEKSLEQLEKEDLIYRHQLSRNNDSDKSKSSQLLLQRQVYRKVLELGIKIHSLPTFQSLEEYQKSTRKLLKSLLKIQKTLQKLKKTPKISEISQFFEMTWNFLADSAREWSSRVDLKIGADIVDQVVREAEKKTDFDIQLFLMRELKTENSVQVQSSSKKAKHKFSKHRKLKFDVHEKLQNFMTPENLVWDSKKENLVNSLFGKKIESTEKVYLDVPLV
jgi:hypothetical protein